MIVFPESTQLAGVFPSLKPASDAGSAGDGFQQMLEQSLQEVNAVDSNRPSARDSQPAGKDGDQEGGELHEGEEETAPASLEQAVAALAEPVIVAEDIPATGQAETEAAPAVEGVSRLCAELPAVPAATEEQTEQPPVAEQPQPQSRPEEAPIPIVAVETTHPQIEYGLATAQIKELPQETMERLNSMITDAQEQLQSVKNQPEEPPTAAPAPIADEVMEPAEDPAAPLQPQILERGGQEQAEDQPLLIQNRPLFERQATEPVTVSDEDRNRTEEPAAPMEQYTQPIRQEPAPVQSEPQPVTRAPLPDQAEQIRVQLIEQLENQNMEFRMQLQPQELGKVDVRMVMESGRIAVEIIAANPRAAELLSRNVEGLAASLRASSIQVESVQVVERADESQSEMRGAFNMDHSNGSDREDRDGQGRGSGKHVFLEEEQAESADDTPPSMLNVEI